MSAKVSIIMGARGRASAVRRTLQSYKKLSYKNYELLFVDVDVNGENLQAVYDEFCTELPIKYLTLKENLDTLEEGVTTWTPATTWNYGMTKADGEFIITCSHDLILSKPDLIERFLDQYTNRRISVLTYFLGYKHLGMLSGAIDWLGNPDSIQSLHGFWDDVINGDKNKDRKSAGITTFMTGQSRAAWDWFGRFRKDLSHLVNDQDIVMREMCLGIGAETLKDYVVYHQPHPGLVGMDRDKICQPGWHYKNELQARLLEPAERDLA
jgi:glycosyltransferase involved in cell wall biosynthesis